MKNIAAIVLAAGKGTRMKSALPKVLHTVSGRPMLSYPLAVLRSLGVNPIVTVVGHGSGEVKAAFKADKLCFVEQTPQLGTGDAVRSGMKGVPGGFSGEVLILSGDVPLITRETIKGFLKFHRRGKKAERPLLSLVSAVVEDPTGYGRIVRDDEDNVVSIVEEKDASRAEREISEVNTGIYLVDAKFLRDSLRKLGKGNKQGEYYLTDLVAMAAETPSGASALTHIDSDEVMGVNDRLDLAQAEVFMRLRTLEGLMLSGVTVRDPLATYIDYGVKVGVDAVIEPGVHLIGETKIGEGAVIEEGSRIEDSTIGKGTTIRSRSIIEKSKVGACASVGPFARLRPGTVVKDEAKIGNFVEVKNSVIGRGSKAGHLSYIGDTEVGKDVNIGAGTITCNYDGKHKHRTIIREGAFIGSDSQLVAPVTVGKGAYVASGSTVTKDVPAGALALTRPEQRIFKGWALKRGFGKKTQKKKPQGKCGKK